MMQWIAWIVIDLERMASILYDVITDKMTPNISYNQVSGRWFMRLLLEFDKIQFCIIPETRCGLQKQFYESS